MRLIWPILMWTKIKTNVLVVLNYSSFYFHVISPYHPHRYRFPYLSFFFHMMKYCRLLASSPMVANIWHISLQRESRDYSIQSSGSIRKSTQVFLSCSNSSTKIQPKRAWPSLWMYLLHHHMNKWITLEWKEPKIGYSEQECRSRVVECSLVL